MATTVNDSTKVENAPLSDAIRADWRARTGGDTELRRIVYTEEDIAQRVAEMGREISDSYPANEEILALGLLKGSFIFVADLVREIERPVHVDFLVASSYGAGTVSSGDLRLLYDPEAKLEGRHVILVEDIIDSGHTINRLIPLLLKRNPKSLELCALLHKRIAPPLALEPRWVGFDAPQEFLIGYGLDHAESFRHVPYIASL
jgi:hypoxanthine phosphoribosyltransferase